MAFKDTGAVLRGLTLEFFREGLETFEHLKDEMDNFPASEEALRDWLGELCQYSQRAQDLCERWKNLHPDVAGRENLGPERVPRALKKTPFELP